MVGSYFWRHPLAEQVRAEGREEGRQQGRAEAKAQMILQILEWRGVPVSEDVREQVNASTDLDQLDIWAQRAVHATEATELFTEE
ncbi:hypothetical protein [Streptomyces bangladeshensis]|uniref:Transposase n=1 Tax=Streptomyces bangladeshensis TaxID=295352 RepID=A0ABN3BFF1_9ACTN